MKLYRECYCLGKGRITADVIFTVCSEKLIFLRYLKLKCFYKLPLLTTQRSIRSMQLTLTKKGSQSLPERKSIIWYDHCYLVSNLLILISTKFTPE